MSAGIEGNRGTERLRRLPTAELMAAQIEAIRGLLWRAFPDGDEAFTEDDWDHALGGDHVVVEVDGRIVAHAAVVERELHVGGRPLQTGYVEAVAVEPTLHGRGLGTRVMTSVNDLILERFELGALGSGAAHFYERLGWRRWAGPSGVRTDGGVRPTPDDDGYLFVLATPSTPSLRFDEPITCDPRAGDDW